MIMQVRMMIRIERAHVPAGEDTFSPSEVTTVTSALGAAHPNSVGSESGREGGYDEYTDINGRMRSHELGLHTCIIMANACLVLSEQDSHKRASWCACLQCCMACMLMVCECARSPVQNKVIWEKGLQWCGRGVAHTFNY